MLKIPGFFSKQKSRLLLFVFGIALVIVSFTADSSGLGETKDFGLGQFTLAGIGIGIAILGIFSRPEDFESPRTFGKLVIRLYQGIAVLILNAILLAFIVEVSAMGILRAFPEKSETPVPRPIRVWENIYWDEYLDATKKTQYYPYSIWRAMPFQGETINIDTQGIRQTPRSDCKADSYQVFTFGGSAMWGQGAPDWETIPAHIQVELQNSIDQPVCTINFAQRGFVATQNLVELIGQLQQRNIPDLVIFYDGYNEIQAAYPEMKIPTPHVQQAQIETRFENPLLEWFQRTQVFLVSKRVIPPNSPVAEPELLAAKIVQSYLETFRIVDQLAENYGFKYAFFWQPTVLVGTKSLTPYEAVITSKNPSDFDITVEKTYQLIELTAHDNEHLRFLGHVFDETEEWIYFDAVHINDHGNQIVAQEILRAISSQVLSK